jgi:5'-nucleotidase
VAQENVAVASDSPKIALFDMDGTLVDFDGAIQRDMRKLQAPGEVPYIRGSNDEDVPYLDARLNLIRRQPGWWKNLERLQLGWDVLEAARDIGFDITVLTKGPYNTTSAWTEKVEWCRRELPHVKVTITEDKSTVYGRVLVDDWPKYVTPWLNVRPRGVVIMPAHRWNEGYSHERVVRYDGNNNDEVEDVLYRAFER